MSWFLNPSWTKPISAVAAATGEYNSKSEPLRKRNQQGQDVIG